MSTYEHTVKLRQMEDAKKSEMSTFNNQTNKIDNNNNNIDEHDYPNKTDFKYVDSMNKERLTMTNVVQEVIRKREFAYLYDNSADLDVNRNEWEAYVICQLCERTYPKSQLPGIIPTS